jgi:hypothetical protein
MNVETLEFAKLKECIDELANNLYVQTATWGLDYFEAELGIDTDISKTYEERRERILAKKRGTGTSTKQMIRNTAESFTAGEVVVIENFKDYSFSIKFIDTNGSPRNIDTLTNMIDEIKPAHLDYEIIVESPRTLKIQTKFKSFENSYLFSGIADCSTQQYNIAGDL